MEDSDDKLFCLNREPGIMVSSPPPGPILRFRAL